MPTSYLEATPVVLALVRAEQPKSILDIGVGFGKYGMLLREMFEIPFERYEPESWTVRIDGVEGCPDYRNPVHDHVYDSVRYGDIRELIDELPDYDVILMIDIIEHFEKAEGLKLLDRVMAHARKAVIVSTPLDPAKEQEYYQHYPLEQHWSRWSEVDFVSYDCTFSIVPIGHAGAFVYKLKPSPPRTTASTADVWSGLAPTARSLRVAYLLPHHRVTGGMVMLLEQMRYLESRGHTVRALRLGNGGPVLPPWSTLRTSEEARIDGPGQLVEALDGCDVLAACWLDDVARFHDADIPILYVEQGHEWLFGEMPQQAEQLMAYMRQIYESPRVALAAVSGFLAEALRRRYRREVGVVSAWLSEDRFRPCTEPERRPLRWPLKWPRFRLREDELPVVLMVGNPALRFKGHRLVLNALDLCWRRGARFRVRWIVQHPGNIDSTAFEIEQVVSPAQDALAAIYSSSTVMVSASAYEAFGLPPLEAMASGTAVVATHCGGIAEYARHGENALLCAPYDLVGLAGAIEQVLREPELRDALVRDGLRTAEAFTPAARGPDLEQALARAAAMGGFR
jgi:glycosyltransferase involved in cell wall biosynthesis